MPKMKTKRAAAKKDHKMKKNLGKAGLVHVADEVRVKMLIPYK